MRVKRLIDIAYLIAKEEMPFNKFTPIAKQEKNHGVPLGEIYIINDHQCAEFIDSVVEEYEE